MSRPSNGVVNRENQAYPYHLPLLWHTDVPDSSVPASWDWREKATLTTVQDQGACGCCWAFSSAQMLTDRTRIAARKQDPTGTQIPLVSVEAIKDCATVALASVYDQYVAGCGECAVGGMTSEGCEYLELYGAPSSEVLPYSQQTYEGHDVGTCASATGSKRYSAKYGSTSRVCLGANGDAPASSVEQVQAKLSTETIAANVLNMQKNIMLYGPLGVVITAYHDLVSADFSDADYPDGVYRPNVSSGIDGGHALNVVGWGTAPGGTLFWWVRNSWGATWNGNGYYKHLRGANAASIESAAVSVQADTGAPPPKLPRGSVPASVATSTGLSTAAKWGIGVGVGVVAAVLLVVILVVVLRRNSRS